MSCCRHRSRCRLALLLVACAAGMLSLPRAEAATYYVRKTGNNANAGTAPATAWLTINQAATTIVAGDTAYVGAGTYTEQVVPSRDGAVASPIKLVADIAGAFTGDAGNVLVNGNGLRPFDCQRNYYQLIGFKLFNGTTGVRFRNRTGCRLEDCEVYSQSTLGVDISANGTTIVNCTVRNNTGNGLRVTGTCTVTVQTCLFHGNAGYGARGESAGSVVAFDRCRSYGNTGRGFDLQRGTFTLKNALIYNNGGVGIYVGTGSPTATVWNATVSGSGSHGAQVANGTLTLTNSIVAFSAANGLRRTGGTLTHTYNVVYGSTSANFNGTSQSTGELTGDPLFVNRASNDYHLAAGSPAVNAGTTAAGTVDVDLDNNARPIGAAWDIGCYEAASGGGPPGVRIIKWLEIP